MARELASAFVKKEGVIGVVFLGALARGHFDEHSDIDIVVFKRRGAKLGWPREREYEYGGFLIDLEVRDYERDLRRPWSLEERWMFLRARVYYDPEGLVRRLIELKVALDERESRRALEEELRKAAWSLGDADAWIRRGDALSAHYAVTTALRHLLRSLMVLNGVPPPPDKWLVHSALNAERAPLQIRELVRAALTARELSASELESRRAALLDLRNWIVEQLGRNPV